MEGWGGDPPHTQHAHTKLIICDAQAARGKRKSGKSSTPGGSNRWKLCFNPGGAKRPGLPPRKADFDKVKARVGDFTNKGGARIWLSGYVDEHDPKLICITRISD